MPLYGLLLIPFFLSLLSLFLYVICALRKRRRLEDTIIGNHLVSVVSFILSTCFPILKAESSPRTLYCLAQSLNPLFTSLLSLPSHSCSAPGPVNDITDFTYRSCCFVSAPLKHLIPYCFIDLPFTFMSTPLNYLATFLNA